MSIKIRVVEIGDGVWRAVVEGREDTAVNDRSPDQALAGLIRANLRAFGIAEIRYGSDLPPAGAADAPPRDPPGSPGRVADAVTGFVGDPDPDEAAGGEEG